MNARFERGGAGIARIVCGLVLAIGLQPAAWGHGGEDHGEAAPAPVTAPGATANMLTTYGTTDLFELLLKYSPPEVGSDAPLRFYLADYATNRPIVGGSFDLSFTPSGASIVKPPVMTAPGVYDLVVRFPADTIYTLVATVRAERRSDFLELRNIYTGAHADRFLAAHGGGGSALHGGSPGFPWWGIVAAAAIALLLPALLLRRFRRRREVGVPAYREPSAHQVRGIDELQSKEEMP